MLHQLFVEWSAITLGDTESIYRVIRSAAGKGAVTDHSFIVRARAVLDRVPQDDLRRVLAKVEIVEPDLLKALIAQGKIV
jgi:putative chitinase